MKRITAVILSFILIMSCVGANAAVTDIADTGKTVITDGNWAYEKVNADGWEIDEYIGEGQTPSIPLTFANENITTVGDYAFNNNASITAVDTNSGIVSIGDYAFNSCTALTEITLYEALSQIGVGCFYGDTLLTSMNLQDTSITSVAAYCFALCGFTEVTLPDTCTSIGNYAFYHCAAMTKISIPDSVTQIADNAFADCTDLVIFGSEDSYAITYAKAHDIAYVAVSGTYICGDADGDGEVTIIDATRIQRILADLDPDEDGMGSLRGDVNSDGLDIMDATKIQRYLVDLDYGAPIGEVMTITA